MKLSRILIFLTVLWLLVLPAAIAQDAMQPGTIHNKDAYEAATGQTIAAYNEAPELAARVAAGELPPVAERLPENPPVVVPWNEVGQYGGTLRWDEFTADYDHYLRHILNIYPAFYDTSATTYYSSGPTGASVPFIVEGWESNEDATQYTIFLRKGLKWSDGDDVTTEDVRYRVENELLNEEITPQPPLWLRWNPEQTGVTTEVTIVDDYTFQVTFAMPYGSFINNEFRLSWGSWPNWFAPSHFLKAYHKDFTDIAEILPAMAERSFNEEGQWVNFYTSIMATVLGDGGGYVGHPYITTFPVLYGWKAAEVLDDGGIIFERNPYFFAVDTAGNQLPYIDNLRRQFIADSELMNLDIIAGNTDVQTMFIRISDFPLFKENEANGNYVAIPKRAWQHHVLIYWLNPAVADPVLSAALSNLDFRRALSLALDRNQINEAVFLGLGTPAQFAPPAGTPLYNEELTNYYAAYDPDQAMQLLEGLGYVDVDGDGFREAPDGSDFLLPITFYEVTPAAIPGAQFAEQYWEAIGIEVDAKQLEGGAFWQQQGANQVAASIWWANGPDFSDGAFINQNVNVREWSVWRSSDGEAGIEPPDWVKRIWQIQQERLVTASEEERRAMDAEGWKLLTENLTIIGTVEGAMNPLVLNAGLGNVQYGFEQDFVPQTFLEYSFQWYFADPARREG